MYKKTKYNFWGQVDPKPFQYDLNYKQKQSTNIEMSYLRVGWLSSFFTYDEMKNMSVVDIGCGNGIFVSVCKNIFKEAVGFDVSGDSIPKTDLYDKPWDIMVLSDVLEHFVDIDELFDYSWKYAFISFPETPVVDNVDDLKEWRHFKPDEHIWCLNAKGLRVWSNSHNAVVVGESNFEDIIRTRWEYDKANISSILIKKL